MSDKEENLDQSASSCADLRDAQGAGTGCRAKSALSQIWPCGFFTSLPQRMRSPGREFLTGQAAQPYQSERVQEPVS
jgi:hypothetical protein